MDVKIKINNSETIINESLFISSHQARIRSELPKRLRDPFFKRLRDYAEMKRVKLCVSCGELLTDDIVKCPNCLGINNP